MEEAPQPLEVSEPQKEETRRRIAEEPYDFSQIDFTNNPQIRESVARGARRLIEIQQRHRRIDGSTINSSYSPKGGEQSCQH